MKGEERFLLSWKGAQLGPLTISEIRSQLDEGSISRLHQIKDKDGWISLDEFLNQQEQKRKQSATLLQAQREREIEQRLTTIYAAERSQLQQEHERQLAEERTARENVESRLAGLETRLTQPWPHSTNPVYRDGRTGRTSGFAVAALIMGLLNFIPILNLVTWVLAIVFGHVALSQTRSDPMLAGRGMAIAGLAITYSLLGLGIAWLLLAPRGFPLPLW